MQSYRRTETGRKRPTVSLLLRHRWLGDPRRELYRCTWPWPSLYDSPDPLCGGCSRELAWSDVPGLNRCRGLVSRSRLIAEDLGLRLDLRVLELALELTRAERWPRVATVGR